MITVVHASPTAPNQIHGRAGRFGEADLSFEERQRIASLQETYLKNPEVTAFFRKHYGVGSHQLIMNVTANGDVFLISGSSTLKATQRISTEVLAPVKRIQEEKQRQEAPQIAEPQQTPRMPAPPQQQQAPQYPQAPMGYAPMQVPYPQYPQPYYPVMYPPQPYGVMPPQPQYPYYPQAPQGLDLTTPLQVNVGNASPALEAENKHLRAQCQSLQAHLELLNTAFCSLDDTEQDKKIVTLENKCKELEATIIALKEKSTTYNPAWGNWRSYQLGNTAYYQNLQEALQQAEKTLEETKRHVEAAKEYKKHNAFERLNLNSKRGPIPEELPPAAPNRSTLNRLGTPRATNARPATERTALPVSYDDLSQAQRLLIRKNDYEFLCHLLPRSNEIVTQVRNMDKRALEKLFKDLSDPRILSIFSSDHQQNLRSWATFVQQLIAATTSTPNAGADEAEQPLRSYFTFRNPAISEQVYNALCLLLRNNNQAKAFLQSQSSDSLDFLLRQLLNDDVLGLFSVNRQEALQTWIPFIQTLIKTKKAAASEVEQPLKDYSELRNPKVPRNLYNMLCEFLTNANETKDFLRNQDSDFLYTLFEYLHNKQNLELFSEKRQQALQEWIPFIAEILEQRKAEEEEKQFANRLQPIVDALESEIPPTGAQIQGYLRTLHALYANADEDNKILLTDWIEKCRSFLPTETVV